MDFKLVPGKEGKITITGDSNIMDYIITEIKKEFSKNYKYHISQPLKKTISSKIASPETPRSPLEIQLENNREKIRMKKKKRKIKEN